MTPLARRVLIVTSLITVVLLVGLVVIVFNRLELNSVQADREKRIAERCERDHENFVAQTHLVDFIDDLIHQGDLDDPRIPEDLRALAKESRLKSEEKLAEVRELIQEGDCEAFTAK